MKYVVIYSILAAIVVNASIVLAQSIKLDYKRYTIESTCAMKQVQAGVPRKEVDFAKCKEITWEPKI